MQQGLMRVLLAGRWLLVFAALGGFLSALMMFLVGFSYIFDALHFLTTAGHQTGRPYKYVVIGLLEAADAFMFALVFVLFGYAVAIGFVFKLPDRYVRRLPHWMRVEGGELRRLIFETVLVGLIVLFAAIAIEEEKRIDWDDLSLPISILLLTLSSRLLRRPRSRTAPQSGSAQKPPRVSAS